MAKIFADTNFFIDLIENRKRQSIDDLGGNELFISSLSVHILIYITKKKIPDPVLSAILKHFWIIDFNLDILSKALEGPTRDFEDNVQLHSAVEVDCDFFISSDQKLLNWGIFGKTQIISSIESLP